VKGHWINAALGVWMCVSAALLAHTPAAATNNLFLGLSIFLVAFLAMGIEGLWRLNAVLGAWAVISPFALGYMNSTAALSDVVVGIAVVAVSFRTPGQLARQMERHAT